MKEVFQLRTREFLSAMLPRVLAPSIGKREFHHGVFGVPWGASLSASRFLFLWRFVNDWHSQQPLTCDGTHVAGERLILQGGGLWDVGLDWWFLDFAFPGHARMHGLFRVVIRRDPCAGRDTAKEFTIIYRQLTKRYGTPDLPPKDNQHWWLFNTPADDIAASCYLAIDSKQHIYIQFSAARVMLDDYPRHFDEFPPPHNIEKYSASGDASGFPGL